MSAWRGFWLGVLVTVLAGIWALEAVHLTIDGTSYHGFCGLLHDGTERLVGTPITRIIKLVYKFGAWPVKTASLHWFEQDIDPTPVYLSTTEGIREILSENLLDAP